MTQRGREIAVQHGASLPAFSNLEEARAALFSFRDEHLTMMGRLVKNQSHFSPDFGPESLKDLESWYFQLLESGSFESTGVTRGVFETCVAMYFGETAVRSARAEWVVQEYFLAPGRYELGVSKARVAIMLHQFADHHLRSRNKRRQSLYRLYQKLFSR